MQPNPADANSDGSVEESQPLDNRALSQESRYEPARVIPLKRDASLLDWLEGNGRLLAREKQDDSDSPTGAEEDDISGLMEDDRDYDDGDEDNSDFNNSDD